VANLKTALRNALPRRWQVPIKYAYGRARGDIEPEMALLPLLASRGERAIDVGGNRGTYAYRLWKLGVRVEIFEPNPHCAAILHSWAAGRDRVSVHEVALSSRSGTAELHVPVDAQGVEHDASASIEHAAPANSHDYRVPLRPLDSFGFHDAVLVKIDVEGHESSVIEGAQATLKASTPALLVEIEQRHNRRPIAEIFGQIEQLGYRGFFLLGGKLVPVSAFDPDTHQSLAAFEGGGRGYHNNFLFLHAKRLDAGRYKVLSGRWMAR